MKFYRGDDEGFMDLLNCDPAWIRVFRLEIRPESGARESGRRMKSPQFVLLQEWN